MADILEESDEILRRYDHLKQINLAMQQKLLAMEQAFKKTE
jgi:hypothetical protein